MLKGRRAGGSCCKGGGGGSCGTIYRKTVSGGVAKATYVIKLPEEQGQEQEQVEQEQEHEQVEQEHEHEQVEEEQGLDLGSVEVIEAEM